MRRTVERLVLNLELLEVDEVEAVGELLLLAQDLLELAERVAPADVGEPHLLHLGIFLILRLLERLHQLERDGLACSGVLGALEDLALELVELAVDEGARVVPAARSIQGRPHEAQCPSRRRRRTCAQRWH